MTNKDATGRRGSVWRGETRIAIGRALLRLGSEPASASQLAKASGRDPSNCKRVADSLAIAGALKRVVPDQGKGRPGRRTTFAYAFVEGERERFVDQFGDAVVPGALSASQQLVFIDVRRLSHQHFSELARPDVLANASWSALLDGERQELVIAFEGEKAVDASLDLLALFSTAELEATRATVAKVDSPWQLRRWIKGRGDTK